MSTVTRLRAFQRARRLVRFERPLERGIVHGYAVGVGRRLFLVAIVDDVIRCNGYTVFRVADVRRLRADPYPDFVEQVLARRRSRAPALSRLRLDDLGAVLRGAGSRFPLVTIHQERVYPGECQIGALLTVRDGDVVLQRIRPGGVWEDESASYPLREITRVDFGGSYEEALAIFGGKPPPLRPGAPV